MAERESDIYALAQKHARAKAQGWDKMQFMTERSLQIPPDAPPKLLHDIQSYSALIEMQAKMGSVAPWFQKLS